MQIEKRDVPLYIDVYCHECNKLMALSNAVQNDGRYYCERCLPFDFSAFVENLRTNDLTSE